MGLDWESALVTGSSPARDEISIEEIVVKCNGASFGALKGTLTPQVSEYPALTSELDFDGANAGLLAGPLSGETTEARGIDKIKGPPGDTKISVGP